MRMRSLSDSKIASLPISDSSPVTLLNPLTELCQISKEACDAVAPMLLGTKVLKLLYLFF
jgi:hypothetical protein